MSRPRFEPVTLEYKPKALFLEPICSSPFGVHKQLLSSFSTTPLAVLAVIHLVGLLDDGSAHRRVSANTGLGHTSMLLAGFKLPITNRAAGGCFGYDTCGQTDGWISEEQVDRAATQSS